MSFCTCLCLRTRRSCVVKVFLRHLIGRDFLIQFGVSKESIVWISMTFKKILKTEFPLYEISSLRETRSS